MASVQCHKVKMQKNVNKNTNKGTDPSFDIIQISDYNIFVAIKIATDKAIIKFNRNISCNGKRNKSTKYFCSDKDVGDLALGKYNIDLSKLQNTVQEIQAEIIKYLKKDRGISLRKLSRPTGFTIHRIYKVKV